MCELHAKFSNRLVYLAERITAIEAHRDRGTEVVGTGEKEPCGARFTLLNNSNDFSVRSADVLGAGILV